MFQCLVHNVLAKVHNVLAKVHARPEELLRQNCGHIEHMVH